MRVFHLQVMGLVAVGLLAGCAATSNEVSASAMITNGRAANLNTTLSAGLHHTCAIKTGETIACWGNNGQGNGPDDEDANDVANTITLDNVKIIGAVARADGNLDPKERAAVSAALEGVQLAEGATVDTLLAEEVDVDALLKQMTVAGKDTLYRAASFVAGLDGAYSDEERALIEKILRADAGLDARALPPEGTFVALEAGWRHTCALAAEGAIKCWGDNTDEQVGKKIVDDHGAVTGVQPIEGTFIAVSAGAFHTCGIETSGKVRCWGRDMFGEAKPPQDLKAVTLTAGNAHSCAIAAEGGAAVCWGDNSAGQGRPPEGATFVALSAGFDYTCGVKTDGKVACWGKNDKGQATAPDGTFTSIAASYDHTCGLSTDGKVMCWGGNDKGQTAAPNESFLSVTTGWKYSCGIKSDHRAVCWGHKGDEEFTTGSTPPEISTFQ